jgi:hypothetical protein
MEASIPFPQQRHTKRTFADGPLKGHDEDDWEHTFFPDIPEPVGDVAYVPEITGELDISGPDRPTVAVTGLLRDDLERLTSSEPRHEALPISDDDIRQTYELDGYKVGYYDMEGFVMRVNDAIPFRAKQVQFVGMITRDLVYRSFPREVKLVRPGSSQKGPEAIVLFGRPVGISLGEEGVLARWSPEHTERTGLAYDQELSPSSWKLLSATPGAALLHEIDPFSADSNTWVVTFASQNALPFYGQDLTQDYVLLAPDFLYNVVDTRFHLLEAALPATALPVALASAEPRPAPLAAYHLIRLP